MIMERRSILLRTLVSNSEEGLGLFERWLTIADFGVAGQMALRLSFEKHVLHLAVQLDVAELLHVLNDQPVRSLVYFSF